jgi:hypothetical protein
MSAYTDESEIENSVQAAWDLTERVMPMPALEDRAKPGSPEWLRWQDLLNLRREAFGQVLAQYLSTEVRA